jgi:hypothetical protein
MGGKVRLAVKTDNPLAVCELIVQKMWKPKRLTIHGPPLPATRTLPFFKLSE